MPTSTTPQVVPEAIYFLIPDLRILEEASGEEAEYWTSAFFDGKGKISGFIVACISYTVDPASGKSTNVESRQFFYFAKLSEAYSFFREKADALVAVAQAPATGASV